MNFPHPKTSSLAARSCAGSALRWPSRLESMVPAATPLDQTVARPVRRLDSSSCLWAATSPADAARRPTRRVVADSLPRPPSGKNVCVISNPSCRMPIR